VIWLFLKINLSTPISMKRSRRELSIDLVIRRGIFKNNQSGFFSRLYSVYSLQRQWRLAIPLKRKEVLPT